MPKERRGKDPYKIHYAEAICESELAEKYDFGTGEDIWIPKSQISDQSEDRDEEQWIEIPEWLAYEKGLL